MAYVDLLRTVHCPVSSDGNFIKNSFGVVIARVVGDDLLAEAIATMINLGIPEALRQREFAERHEEAIARLLKYNREKEEPAPVDTDGGDNG